VDSSESAAELMPFIENMLYLYSFTAENIVSVEIIENGNLKISVITNSTQGEEKEHDEDYYLFENTHLLEYELTSDNKLIGIEIKQKSRIKQRHDGVYSYKEFALSMNCEVEYNTITEEYINQLLEEAISKDLKAAE